MDHSTNNEKAKLVRKRYEASRVKVTIRFSRDEMKAVVEFADKAGRPVATYIHDVSMNPHFKIVPPRPKVNTETKALILRMGINFNQIARSMNNYYEKKNFEKISRDLAEIATTLRDILDKI
jgi:hypothetical protein